MISFVEITKIDVRWAIHSLLERNLVTPSYLLKFVNKKWFTKSGEYYGRRSPSEYCLDGREISRRSNVDVFTSNRRWIVPISCHNIRSKNSRDGFVSRQTDLGLLGRKFTQRNPLFWILHGVWCDVMNSYFVHLYERRKNSYGLRLNNTKQSFGHLTRFAFVINCEKRGIQTVRRNWCLYAHNEIH